VVVISADAMPGQIDNLLKAGARDYLTKPIDIEVFLRVVDEWLGIGQPETM
jgi:CheY-like chemotaxis protein